MRHYTAEERAHFYDTCPAYRRIVDLRGEVGSLPFDVVKALRELRDDEDERDPGAPGT